MQIARQSVMSNKHYTANYDLILANTEQNMSVSLQRHPPTTTTTTTLYTICVLHHSDNQLQWRSVVYNLEHWVIRSVTGNKCFRGHIQIQSNMQSAKFPSCLILTPWRHILLFSSRVSLFTHMHLKPWTVYLNNYNNSKSKLILLLNFEYMSFMLSFRKLWMDTMCGFVWPRDC